MGFTNNINLNHKGLRILGGTVVAGRVGTPTMGEITGPFALTAC